MCEQKAIYVKLNNESTVCETILREKRFREKINSIDIGLHERKKFKTNVFSGVSKVSPVLRSLKELCYEKLNENLDKLVINKDMDYSLIRPVLTKCSVNQLERLVANNPLLESQTEDLWLDFCRNKFHFRSNNSNDHNYYNNSVPNKTSSESWRQFYWRSIEYRNKKLNEITATIKDKNYSIKSSQRLTKVCETEINKLKTPEPIPKKALKVSKKAPLMKKCLQMKSKKFML